MRKITKILVLSAIVAGIVVVAVVAAYVFELTIPGSVVVVETPVTTDGAGYKLEAFEDAICTKPLTYVDWGSMQCGEGKHLDIYIKNVGELSFANVKYEVLSDVQYAGGGYAGGLEPGQSVRINLLLMIDTDAAPGEYSVTIKITGVA